MRFVWPVVVVVCAAVAGALCAFQPLAVVPIAGLMVVGLLSRRIRDLIAQAPWAVPLVLTTVLLCIDVTGQSAGFGVLRFAVTAAAIVAVLLLRPRRDVQDARLLWWLMGALFAYGVVGTFVGRLYGAAETSALPLLLPLAVPLLGALPVRRGPESYRIGLTWISAVGIAFTLVAGAIRQGWLPQSQLLVANHEKAFVMVAAVTCAIAARRYWLAAVALGALVSTFAAYPAATFALVGLVAVGTIWVARWQSTRRGRGLIGLGVLITGGWAVLHVDTLIGYSAAYFNAVGKVNNGVTRQGFYAVALRELNNSPFSHFFTSNVTIAGRLNDQRLGELTVHNDYLSIALGGGLVAAALFAGIFLAANGLVLRRLPVAEPMQRRAMLALLAALNGAAVSAFANPVFLNPGGATAAWAVLAALIAVSLAGSGGLDDDHDRVVHGRSHRPEGARQRT